MQNIFLVYIEIIREPHKPICYNRFQTVEYPMSMIKWMHPDQQADHVIDNVMSPWGYQVINHCQTPGLRLAVVLLPLLEQ